MDNNSMNNKEDYKEENAATQGDIVNMPPASDEFPSQDSCINIPSLSNSQNDNAIPHKTLDIDSECNYEDNVNQTVEKDYIEEPDDIYNAHVVHNHFGQQEMNNFQQHQKHFGNPSANGFNQGGPHNKNTPYGNGCNQSVPPENFNNPYGNGVNQSVPPENFNNPYGNGVNQSVPPENFNNPYGNGVNQSVPPENFNNPYANTGNVSQPKVEYVPYIPGTTLPNGVTPQFINGGWYYPVIKFTQVNKKKMATSVKVLLSIIVSLTLAFIVLLVVWCSNLENGNNSVFDFDNNNNFTFELPTFPDESSNTSGEVGKYANPDGPEINLEKNNTVSGSTEKAYEALSDSVVSVAVYNKGCSPVNDTSISEGTGIILTSNGYMVTNSHVINDSAESNVYVTTKNGKVFSAVVIGCDVRTDIAVLKSDEAVGWKPASFADSTQLKVGQDVVAIGSPGGASYSNSLTRGIVSALDRSLSGSAVTYIQTDAAINPGNSGGPLANLNGQVVGINTIKVVDTEYEGMGFAIPSVTIKEIADQLIKNGYVKGRVRMGIVGKEISEETAKILGGEAGISINSIDDDSPLKNTKVKEGDVITKINDIPITSFNELFSTLDSYNIGDKVTLSIYREAENTTKKEEYFTVEITLLGESK